MFSKIPNYTQDAHVKIINTAEIYLSKGNINKAVKTLETTFENELINEIISPWIQDAKIYKETNDLLYEIKNHLKTKL